MQYGESNMAFSGKCEHGMDRSCAPNSRKLRTTRLVGSIESGMNVNARLKSLESSCARRRYVKTVSALLVICAAAIVVISAVAMAPLGKATASQTVSEKARAPGPPHGIFGQTFDTDGSTPVPGCIVHITNIRTGETLVYDSTREFWDPNSNIYSVDLSELQIILPPATQQWEYGDILNVTAWNPNGLFVGWTEAPVTDNINQYDIIDVTLNHDASEIPEFPMVIVPVGGMIALFVVVGLRRRVEEQ